MNQKAPPKFIHAACILLPQQSVRYLLLRKISPFHFEWTINQNDHEDPTQIGGPSISEAIHAARKVWQNNAFRTIGCGFRYMLPERDEHGCNALFHQMIASYNTPNGIYFDEEVGYNCIVHFASQEARDLWKQLRSVGRLQNNV